MGTYSASVANDLGITEDLEPHDIADRQLGWIMLQLAEAVGVCDECQSLFAAALDRALAQ